MDFHSFFFNEARKFFFTQANIFSKEEMKKKLRDLFCTTRIIEKCFNFIKNVIKF